jgi:flagellum-specific ATP synthase
MQAGLRGGFDFGSISAAADSRGAGGDGRGGIFLRAGQARSAGGGFADPAGDGAARDRAGCGEPPTAKGYTPSCFTMLARLIERAGRFGQGSITAFYTVLMEGDDEQDPLVDGARALLDGHVMLDRRLAVRSHYPPIAILDSVSRLMPAVSSAAHLQKAQMLRRLLAAYAASEDLVRIGAYQKGSDSTLDKALTLIPELDHFLMQKPGDAAPLAETIDKLLALPG